MRKKTSMRCWKNMPSLDERLGVCNMVSSVIYSLIIEGVVPQAVPSFLVKRVGNSALLLR